MSQPNYNKWFKEETVSPDAYRLTLGAFDREMGWWVMSRFFIWYRKYTEFPYTVHESGAGHAGFAGDVGKYKTLREAKAAVRERTNKLEEVQYGKS